MKNLILALAMTLLLAACSSGSTVAPLPSTISGAYSGTFANTDGNQEGTALINLSQLTIDSEVTGNGIFDITVGNPANVCLLNGTVSMGTNNGTSASLVIQNANFQLAVSDDGNTLSGTYVVTMDTDECSNGTGSGTITLTR